MSINIYDEILFDYQKKTVDKLIAYDKHLVGLDMGLGKTLTSLSILQKRFEGMKKRRALILCQKTKRNDWEKVVRENFADINVINLDGKKTKKAKKILLDARGKEVILIASYKMAYNRQAELKWIFTENSGSEIINFPHEMSLIIDESQIFKDHKGVLGQWGVIISETIRYISLLSGDPISKEYKDLFNQMKMLGMKMEWYEFANTFIIYEMQHRGTKMFPKIIGYRLENVLFEALHSQSVLIETKDVKDLPEQNFLDIILDLERSSFYKSILKNRMIEVKGEEYSFEQSGVLKMALRQASSGFIKNSDFFSNHKLDAVKDLLNSTNDGFVIFYNFNQELSGLKKLMEKMRMEYYEINGHKNEYEISKTIASKHVLLVQYTAGSHGLDLQYFKRMIFFSPTEKGGEYKQAIKRIHRIGQKFPVFYYKLITKGTVERRVYASLEKSQDYTEAMFKADVETNNW